MKTSLIYPVYNRGELLRRSLKRVYQLPTQPDEIILIDDGSDENIKEIAEQFQCEYYRIDNPKYDACSKPKNVGLRKAKHDIVIFSEPEIIFATDFVGQVKERLKKNEFVCAGTIYFEKRHYRLSHNREFVFELNEATIREWITGTEDVHADDSCLTVAKNMVALFTIGAYKKDLEQVGGWDEDMMLDNGGGGYGFDDTDLVTRLRVNGVNQKLYEDAKALHQWHERVPFPQADGWKRNEQIFLAKKRGDDIPKDGVMANMGREWGKL